ncbi:N-acetylmuramoyl-L-alanine amidase [Dactylosporangium sp. CA-052675]|uniref:N-acetylmuramoyl-L-alanine amidase n=1 Tax=Dactylosporangium sp. CA-052675 TaxID=3239927 RepID=UPI003D92AA22
MRVAGIAYVQGRNSYLDADGTKFGIAIHNTSNTAPADGEAAYATRRTDGVSSHFYCDGVKVIQSLDTSARAGHAGSSQGNQNAVAVEITGTNDKSRDWWLANVAWSQLGAVLAQVCRAYGIQVRRASVAEMQANPKVRAFYSHDDMRRAWGGTDHTDPGPAFPWDRLFSAVNAALSGGDDDMTPEQDERLKNIDTWLRCLIQGDAQIPLKNNGQTSNWPNKLGATVARIDATATALAGRPALELTDEQAAALGDRVAAAVVAHPDTPLGDADRPAIVAAVKQALREGIGA